jgi:cytochrome P450
MPGYPYQHGQQPLNVSLLSEQALREPYGIYKRLRHERPVAFLPEQNFWLVTRYDDCEYVLTHPEKFSSREAVSSTNAYRRSPEALSILSRSKGHPRAKTLIMSDPPDHTRYRAILQRALAPAKTLRELTPRIQMIVDELIDGFCEKGRCEFVREFAYPLPMRVVAALLDVRDEQIDMLKAWSDDFISVQAGNIPDDRIVGAARRTIEFEEFILGKIEERRREKRDDLLGRLIEVRDGEEPLTVQELLNFALQILVGGNESTTNFLGNGLYRLLDTPGLIAIVRSNPERIPDLVEEILRYDAPLQGLFRVALEEHDFDGVTVPKDSKLMLSFGSANHDEKYYGDAEFDPERDNRSTLHLAFGRGIHACAGQAFARREGVIAFETLTRRLPDIRLSSTLPSERQTLFSLRGMKQLHVEFTPASKKSQFAPRMNS